MGIWQGLIQQWPHMTPEERKEWADMGYSPDKKPKVEPSTPNTNGRFNTVQGQAYYAKNERNGGVKISLCAGSTRTQCY